MSPLFHTINNINFESLTGGSAPEDETAQTEVFETRTLWFHIMYRGICFWKGISTWKFRASLISDYNIVFFEVGTGFEFI